MKKTYGELIKARAKLTRLNDEYVEKAKELSAKKDRTDQDDSHLVLLRQHLMPAVQNELAEIEAEIEVMHSLREY